MLFFDIETDGFVEGMTRIHCIHVYDGVKHSRFMFDPVSLPIEMGVKMLEDADEICGHNIINFDIPAIQKIFPWFKPKGKVHDSLVYARLVFGDIKGGDFQRAKAGSLPGELIGSHSLKAYGYRIGLLKGTFGETTDWKQWTPEMSSYCERDVDVLFALWSYIQKRPRSEEAVDLEHAVQRIITRQEKRGFPFNIKGAESLYVVLLGERSKIVEEGEALFPPFYKWDSKTFTPKRDNLRLGYRAGGTCCKVSLTTFNPTSSQHIYVFLRKKYGWEPAEFTERSKIPPQYHYLFRDYYAQEGIAGFPEPKIDDDILSQLSYPEARILSRAMLIQKRIGQLAEGKQAWLKLYSNKTGCLHGAVNTMGAVTRRMTHFNPNIAQVPAVYTEYGPECRELFYAPPGWKLVGADADALEMRLLAHFLAAYDGGEFTKWLLDGKKEEGTDPHSRNAAILSLDRDTAKTWFYAFLYGAGPLKLGKIAGKGKVYGKRMMKQFLSGLPALAKLLKAIQEKVKERGHLLSLDRHPLPVRSQHAALNTLIQSAGAIVMKKALVVLDTMLQQSGLKPGVDYDFVGNIHDEWQILVRTDDGLPEKVGQMAKVAIQKAGEHFGLRCPLTGDYKVGTNWKETH